MVKNLRLSGVSFGISLFCDAADHACLVVGDDSEQLAAELKFGIPNVEATDWGSLPREGGYRIAVLSFPSAVAGDPHSLMQSALNVLGPDSDVLVIRNRSQRGERPRPGTPAWDGVLEATGFRQLERYILLPDMKKPSYMFPRHRGLVREACESGLVALSTIHKKLPISIAVRLLTGTLPGPFRKPDEIIHLGRRSSGDPPRIPGLLEQGATPNGNYRLSILNPAGVGKMTVILSDAKTCEARYLRRVMSVNYPIYGDLRKDVDNLIQLGEWIGEDDKFLATVPAVGQKVRTGDLEIIPQKLLPGIPLLWHIREKGKAWSDAETAAAADKVMQWCVELARRTSNSAPEDIARIAPELLAHASETPDALKPYESAGLDKPWLQHGDLSCRNVFLQPEMESISVIDWDRMALGLPPFFDYFSFLASIGLIQNRYPESMYGGGALQDELGRIFRTATDALGLDPAAGAMWYLRFLWVKCNFSVMLAKMHGAQAGNFQDAPEWIQNHARIYRGWLKLHLDRHKDHFSMLVKGPAAGMGRDGNE